jgi:hypothetical protein
MFVDSPRLCVLQHQPVFDYIITFSYAHNRTALFAVPLLIAPRCLRDMATDVYHYRFDLIRRALSYECPSPVISRLCLDDQRS